MTKQHCSIRVQRNPQKTSLFQVYLVSWPLYRNTDYSLKKGSRNEKAQLQASFILITYVYNLHIVLTLSKIIN